jgi:outer membrane protein OmpA-like peptidoglycan-associated protein
MNGSGSYCRYAARLALVVRERPARAVEGYLIKYGPIAPDRLTIIGYGDSKLEECEATPTAIDSDAAHANMRVRFEVIVN